MVLDAGHNLLGSLLGGLAEHGGDAVLVVTQRVHRHLTPRGNNTVPVTNSYLKYEIGCTRSQAG